MRNPVFGALLRQRRLPWLGRDDDGTLFYAKHPDPAGTLTWVPLEAWRWRQRDRVLQDVRNGEAWYLYRLGAASAQPPVSVVPDPPRPVPAVVAAGSRRTA